MCPWSCFSCPICTCMHDSRLDCNWTLGWCPDGMPCPRLCASTRAGMHAYAAYAYAHMSVASAAAETSRTSCAGSAICISLCGSIKMRVHCHDTLVLTATASSAHKPASQTVIALSSAQYCSSCHDLLSASTYSCRQKSAYSNGTASAEALE